MRLLALALIAVACDPAPTDSGVDTDTDTDTDTGVAVPLAGFGDITGDCGPLGPTDLAGTDALTYVTALDMPTGFNDSVLSDGGAQMLAEGNLNANSLYSEIFAYEVLYRCELAELLLTESGVIYDDPSGKKTDLVVDIDGTRVGVSVVRAVGWPRDAPFTAADVQPTLERKLSDILLSYDNASDADAWQRSMLEVVAYAPEHTDAVLAALDAIAAPVRADTLVYITTTNGEDGFLYGD